MLSKADIKKIMEQLTAMQSSNGYTDAQMQAGVLTFVANWSEAGDEKRKKALMALGSLGISIANRSEQADSINKGLQIMAAGEPHMKPIPLDQVAATVVAMLYMFCEHVCDPRVALAGFQTATMMLAKAHGMEPELQKSMVQYLITELVKEGKAFTDMNELLNNINNKSKGE